MTLEMTRLPTRRLHGSIGIAQVSEADRRRAFDRARRHSWLVRVLKVTLPVLAIVSVAVLFVSPTLLVKVARPDLNASIDSVEVTGDQLRMVNPRFEGFTADKGHYIVSAKAAVQSTTDIDQMHLESVHGHLIEADNSWTDLTAKAGLYETKKRSMRLTDGIVITTSGQARAELDTADIDIDKKKVTSEASVVMTMPNGTLKGQGLLVEGDAKRFVLPEAVEAHLLPPKSIAAAKKVESVGNPLTATPVLSDGPIDVRANRLEVLDGSKTATFAGEVEAKQAGMTLTSEQLEIGYTGEPGANATAPDAAGVPAPGSAQNIRTATALRNVVIVTSDGRKATCDKSIFDQRANSMTLSGTVVLEQAGSTLHADQVVADLTAHKTQVTATNRVIGHFAPVAKAGTGVTAVPAPSGLAGLGSGGGTTDISANSLEISDDTGDAVFQGTVIVSQRGNHLNGERLAINTAHRRMTMSGPGRVSGEFEASVTQGQGKVPKTTQPVAAQPSGNGVGNGFSGLAASDGQPTSVEADSLTVEDERGEATFLGKVVVMRGDNRITAGTLNVFYSGGGAASRDGAQLTRITAKDRVVVNAPGNQVASGDRLLYEPGKNQLVMDGNVTVSQSGNVVRGEKLVVDLETGQSHFETGSNSADSQPLGAASKPGRIQVLITPQGIKQLNGTGPGPGDNETRPKPASRGKPSISASDVLVAPDQAQ